MTGADYERALYDAATEAVEGITSFTTAGAQRYATGLLDGARFSGARIETVDQAVTLVLRAHSAACTRAEAVGQ